jgi:hypothetical protein
VSSASDDSQDSSSDSYDSGEEDRHRRHSKHRKHKRDKKHKKDKKVRIKLLPTALSILRADRYLATEKEQEKQKEQIKPSEYTVGTLRCHTRSRHIYQRGGMYKM